MSLVPNTTDSTFETDVIKSNSPVFVFFYISGDAPSTAMAEDFSRASPNYYGKANFVKLDDKANPKSGRKYGVNNVPACLFYKNGILADKLIAIYSLSKLFEFINRNLQL